MTNFEMVKEFHKKFGLPLEGSFEDENLFNLRLKLLEEEFDEVLCELVNGQVRVKELAKELADLLYVTYGLAASFNIDLDSVFKEVHRSNMSKLGTDGKPVYREDGKVTKGPNYSPANLEGIVG